MTSSIHRASSPRWAAWALASALAAAFSMPVHAQPAASGNAPMAQQRGAGPSAERHAQRMAALKSRLQLTDSQQAAWETYTAAMQPPANAMRADRRAQQQEMANLTTPERMERMQAKRSERIAQSNRRADATKAFYATLTPEQQKVFDAETLKMGPRSGMRGQSGMGPGMGGMQGMQGRGAGQPPCMNSMGGMGQGPCSAGAQRGMGGMGGMQGN